MNTRQDMVAAAVAHLGSASAMLTRLLSGCTAEVPHHRLDSTKALALAQVACQQLREFMEVGEGAEEAEGLGDVEFEDELLIPDGGKVCCQCPTMHPTRWSRFALAAAASLCR